MRASGGGRRADGDVVLEVVVAARARRTAMDGTHGGRLRIRLAARAVDGKANAALVALLADAFGVPKGQVSIEQGARTPRKRVRIGQPQRLPDWLDTP